MTLGQRIQELRKRSGLSQEKLGEELNVSRQAVSKWESDGGVPELDSLIAMSRLFGVTVGQLLGVEEPRAETSEKPEEEDAPPPDPNAAVEAVLRRYVEETRACARPKRRRWVIALCAAAAVAAGLWVNGQLNELRTTINNVNGQVSGLEIGLRNQIASMEYRIQDVLDAGASLFSDFSYSVADFDVREQTVTLELRATLKSWEPGMRGRFVLIWEDGSQVESDWQDGPEFRTALEAPMKEGATGGKLVVEDPSGAQLEQTFRDSIDYVLRPDQYRLSVTQPWIELSGSVPQGWSVHVDAWIWSASPDLIWPEKAEVMVLVDGEERWRRELELEPDGSGDGDWDFHRALEAPELVLSAGELERATFTLRVTDNLGQVIEGYDARGSEPVESPPRFIGIE